MNIPIFITDINMIFLLFSVALAITTEDKEDTCYLLSTYLVRERMEEIKDHIKLYPHLKEPELRSKVIEQGFYYCMDKIKNSEVKDIKKSKKKVYSQYVDLVSSPFDHIKSLSDVKQKPEFVAKKKKSRKESLFHQKKRNKTFSKHK